MPANIDGRPLAVTSSEFKLDSAVYVRQRALRLLRHWWLPLLVVVLATAALACGDIRFLYVLLIELLIAFPMVMCLVWMREALSDDALRETSLHTVTVGDTGLMVDFLQPEGYAPRRSQKFGWSDFVSYHDAGNCVILQWADPKRAPLRMPADVFDEQQWRTVAAILARYLK